MGCKLLLCGNKVRERVVHCMYRVNKDRLFRASSRGNTEGPGVIRNYWFKGSVGGLVVSCEMSGSTWELQLRLLVLSMVRDGGIRGVAVKCLDITKNSDREGIRPCHD